MSRFYIYYPRLWSFYMLHMVIPLWPQLFHPICPSLTEVGKTRMNDINEIYANESVDRWQKWKTYLSWLSFIAASSFLLPTQPLGQMTSDNSRILIFGLVAIVVKSPVLCVLFRNHWYSIQVKPSCNVGFSWKDSQICLRYSSWKLLI